MPFSRKTIIIDCGASRVALGLFSQHRGRLRLDQHLVEVFPAPSGFGEEWLIQTQGALRNLRSQFGRGGPCTLVLPGHVVLTKFIKVPRVKPEQREKVIHFESGQNLPVALSELVWDSVVAAEQETGLEVMLAATHLRKVEPLCAFARAAGFEPRRVLPASLALLGAFRLAHDQPAEPSLVMNIGACSTTFLFVESDRFVVRTFAFGVTRLSADKAITPVQDVAARLVQEFTRSLLFFRRQSGIMDPSRVYLAGGGAQLAGLADALAPRLKLPVESLDLSNAFGMAAPSAVPPAVGPVTELVGAAATELRDGQTRVNLLPPLRQRQAERRRLQALAVAGFALVALPVSAFMVFHQPPRKATGAVRPPEHRVMPVAAAQPPDPASAAAPAFEPLPPETSVDAADFGMELIGIKSEPYRLELAGYLGAPGDYLAVFVTPGQPGIRVARSGQRFDDLGIELRKFDVTTQRATDAEGSAVYEAMAVATLFDENTQEELVLDTRHPTFIRRHAVLRFRTADDAPSAVREDEVLSDDFASYRVSRIEVNPPAVTIARRIAGTPASEVRVLYPTPVTIPTEKPAFANASNARPAQGAAAATR